MEYIDTIDGAAATRTDRKEDPNKEYDNFLAEKVNVNYNIYKNGSIYLSVIITIICFLNFTEPIGAFEEVKELLDRRSHEITEEIDAF